MIPGQSLAPRPDWLDSAWHETLPNPRQLTLAIQRLCQEGEADPVAVVLSEYPELIADRTLLLDLIFEEYLERKKLGQIADAEAFCRRFPAFQRCLRSFILAHSFIKGRPDLLAANPDVPHFEPGQQILGYHVLRELGRGAFAQVLLAAEPALGNRLVAIKVSSQGMGEARTLGRLNHANIVPVYSVQEERPSGLSVVCMPYLGTATLDDVLDGFYLMTEFPTNAGAILQSLQNPVTNRYPPVHRQTPDRVFRHGTYVDGVLHLAVQLADALSFIHSLGICHRDLKPSNVLMTPDGRPMLLDFNLSLNKCLAGEPVAGTPAYMPPEQLLALDQDNESDLPCLIDERSDLYSLGVILYELLTGIHPFEPIPLDLPPRQLLHVLLAKQKKGFRPIRQLNPRVDKGLAETIERCLANDPRARPPTAAELANSFRTYLSRFHRARRWAAWHATFLGVAAILGLAAFSAGAYYLIPSEPFPVRKLHQGLDCYHRGQYQEAIQFLNQAVEAEPASVEPRFARARAFQHLGRIESAFADYEAADELANQQDGRIKACMGYCLSLQGHAEDASFCYQQAIQLNFLTAEVFNNLGYSHLQSKPQLKTQANLDLAHQYLTQALELNDRLQAANYNRAILDIEITVKNPERIPKRGLADIRKAIELGPLTAPLFWDAGRLCALASKTDPSLVPECLDYLEKAIDLGLFPKDIETDFLFHDLKSSPRFQALLNKPPFPDRFQNAVRIVDPIAD